MAPETSRHVAGMEKTDAVGHSFPPLNLQAQVPRETSRLSASYSQVSGPEQPSCPTGQHPMRPGSFHQHLDGKLAALPSRGGLSQCWASLAAGASFTLHRSQLSGLPCGSTFHNWATPATLSDRQDCFSLHVEVRSKDYHCSQELKASEKRSLEEQGENSCFFLPHPFHQTPKPFPSHKRLPWTLPLSP